MIKTLKFGNRLLVFSIVPAIVFDKTLQRVKRWWFAPCIRRNINGCSDMTEYHFGIGYCLVRPQNG